MYTVDWTVDKIKEGFERFMIEHGHFPTAREIDKTNYLPTSRTIQRSFGGLERLRTQLNLPIVNFSKGDNRSRIAKAVNQRGAIAEKRIYKLLELKFGEMFVHIERPFNENSKQRLDFFVFSPSGNFGVDVFHPQDFDSMVRSLNIKQRMYQFFKQRLYLVVANELITQSEIDVFLNQKKNKVRENVVVVDITKFMELTTSMLKYKYTQQSL